MEVLDDMPLLEWSMRNTAAEFGPGTFIIKPGGGQFKDRQATIEISDEYARKAGWNRVEALPPSQAMGMQVAQRATDAMGTSALGVMLEAVMKPLMDRLERIEQRGANGGFDFMQFMALQETSRANSRKEMLETLDLLGRIRGDKPINEEEKEEGGMMTQLGKGLGMGLGELVMKFGKPQPQPVQASPQPQSVQASPQPQPVQAAPPGWTPKTFAQARPLVELLRAHSARLKAGRLMSSAEGMADALSDMLEPEAEAMVLTLAEAVEHGGPQALTVIDASFGDSYWVEVIQTLKRYILEPDGQSLNPTEESHGL